QHDAGARAAHVANDRRDVVAEQLRHLDVHQDQVELLRILLFELGDRARGRDLEAGLLERGAHELERQGAVVDDEDAACVHEPSGPSPDSRPGVPTRSRARTGLSRNTSAPAASMASRATLPPTEIPRIAIACVAGSARTRATRSEPLDVSRK